MDDAPDRQPPRVQVTKAWLAEQQRKQEAYAALRRRVTGVDRVQDEESRLDDTVERTPVAARRRTRLRIVDDRQLGLKL